MPPEAWLDDRLEAYLDDALPAPEREAVEAALRRDPLARADWQAALQRARQIRDGLHALPRPVCPTHVTRAVLEHAARTTAPPPWLARFHAWMQRQLTALWQPALAMALLLLLVVSSSLMTPAPQAVSPEVARARAEVEWTLAFLSEVGRETGQAVREDVFAARVVTPVQDAFSFRTRPSLDHQR